VTKDPSSVGAAHLGAGRLYRRGAADLSEGERPGGNDRRSAITAGALPTASPNRTIALIFLGGWTNQAICSPAGMVCFASVDGVGDEHLRESRLIMVHGPRLKEKVAPEDEMRSRDEDTMRAKAIFFVVAGVATVPCRIRRRWLIRPRRVPVGWRVFQEQAKRARPVCG
jgi:hypothetical protein